jgi:hypothetical protein
MKSKTEKYKIFLIALLMIEGSGIRTNNYGSGSGRPKNILLLQIWIRNNGVNMHKPPLKIEIPYKYDQPYNPPKEMDDKGVLRIRDVYLESRIRIFFHPGSASKN